MRHPGGAFHSFSEEWVADLQHSNILQNVRMLFLWDNRGLSCIIAQQFAADRYLCYS